MNIVKKMFSFVYNEDITEDGEKYSVTTHKILFYKEREIWKNKNNEISRREQPAIIDYHSDGLTPKLEYYYLNGSLLNDEFSPAIIEYSLDKKINKSVFLSNNSKEKVVIEYFRNGNKKNISYYSIINKKYKLGKGIINSEPSFIEFHSNGMIKKESWFIEGNPEIFDIFKPISKKYNEDGKLTNSQYMPIIYKYLEYKKIEIDDITEKDKEKILKGFKKKA